MNYIDPQTDCIVVAGGDGTLMEVPKGQGTCNYSMRNVPLFLQVFTGLMRRIDAVGSHPDFEFESCHTHPICSRLYVGIVPTCPLAS